MGSGQPRPYAEPSRSICLSYCGSNQALSLGGKLCLDLCRPRCCRLKLSANSSPMAAYFFDLALLSAQSSAAASRSSLKRASADSLTDWGAVLDQRSTSLLPCFLGGGTAGHRRRCRLTAILVRTAQIFGFFGVSVVGLPSSSRFVFGMMAGEPAPGASSTLTSTIFRNSSTSSVECLDGSMWAVFSLVIAFPFGLGVGPLAAVNLVSVDDGLQMLRQKAHRQSPNLYLVTFEAVCLFASEQSRHRGASEEADAASRL